LQPAASKYLPIRDRRQQALLHRLPMPRHATPATSAAQRRFVTAASFRLLPAVDRIARWRCPPLRRAQRPSRPRAFSAHQRRVVYSAAERHFTQPAFASVSVTSTAAADGTEATNCCHCSVLRSATSYDFIVSSRSTPECEFFRSLFCVPP